MKSPGQGTSSAEVAALMRLAADLGSKLSEDEGQDIILCLKEAAESSLPGFAKLLKTMDSIEIPDVSHPNNDMELSTDHGDGSEDDNENFQMVAYILSRMNVHINVQLLVIQAVTLIYRIHWTSLSANVVTIVLGIFSSISSHSHDLNTQLHYFSS